MNFRNNKKLKLPIGFVDIAYSDFSSRPTESFGDAGESDYKIAVEYEWIGEWHIC